jgi:DNA-binding MarR family transcriptional regulator
MNMENKKGIIDMIYELKKKCSKIDYQLMCELNLSQSELQFFLALGSCKSISSNELSKHMELSASRISRVVDKLVNNGYLIRDIDPNDRRAITLQLTGKGIEIKETITTKRSECESRVLEALSGEDINDFRNLIKQIVVKL